MEGDPADPGRLERLLEALVELGRVQHVAGVRVGEDKIFVRSEGRRLEVPLYFTAALTGLRQGELVALRWMDVGWVEKRIRVADNFTRGAFDSPKSALYGRAVPLADRLAGELERVTS